MEELKQNLGNEKSKAITNNTENKGKRGETEVDQLNYAIYRPFPATHQVLMPLHFDLSLTNNSGQANRVKFRLNSIYDCVSTTFTSNYTNPAPATDQGDANYYRPQMRKWWQTFYRYYTVIACKYRITIIMDSRSTSPGQLMFYAYKHGQQDPPIYDGNNQLMPHKYRMHHPNVEFKAINTNGGYDVQKIYETTGDAPADQWATTPYIPNSLNNTIEFTGKWRPGDIDHEVLEDQYSETWTIFGKTPTNHEYLTILYQEGRYKGVGLNNVAFRMFIDMEYIVQLKDLDVKYQYIGNNYDQAAIQKPFEDELNVST